MMLRSVVLIYGSLISLAAHSQTSTVRHVLDFPGFRLVGGSADEDGASPSVGAKLCLLQPTNSCYQMPSHADRRGDPVYQFGMEPVSEREPVQSGGSLIFFLAKFSGGGSGTLERAALLRYEPDGTICNLLPYVAVSNQSQRQMWSPPQVSAYPVLVTADFRWNFAAKETHFAPHFYDVTVYVYDLKRDRYVQAFSYATKRKYPGLDSVERIQVLGAEREEIMRRLHG